ncbi:hypothetical protein MtrunA17_Chr3g0089331 [Medicago truncatula]|uniref:Uncharacterized protein n=1 Tax=Medicago truncatula TaxID=3880 RepID=A0A396IKQ8_MEDTR|nr:hypothetical protein MtrunA17_Chr3g0089331 [Medicago truncatula]
MAFEKCLKLTYLCLLALMKSSGRLTILKYQRKLIISPIKGRPI